MTNSTATVSLDGRNSHGALVLVAILEDGTLILTGRDVHGACARLVFDADAAQRFLDALTEAMSVHAIDGVRESRVVHASTPLRVID